LQRYGGAVGTPGAFSRILHQATDFYAAWYPIANVWAVGDIGVVSDGVLVRTGTIKDLGIQFSTQSSPPIKGFDFKSAGTKIAKLIGDTEVNALPDSDIEARLVVEFTQNDSFLMKAATLNVTQMDGLEKVASELAEIKGLRWRRKFRVVYATAMGVDMALVSAHEAGAKFEIHGKASALKQLDLGKAEAGLELSSSDSLGLESVGEAGIVGLQMFKLATLTSGLKVLGGGADEVGIEMDFGPILDDDV
jgi:hypothetical protein